MERGGSENIAGIQILRALAATAIVAVHCWPRVVVLASGVDLFFSISGFIMVYSSRHMFTESGQWKTFMLRRLLRIVPLYWLATIAFLPWAPDKSPDLFFASLFFIPIHHFPTLDVGWTLNLEMVFYLIFAAFLFLPLRPAIVWISATLILIVISARLYQPVPTLRTWGHVTMLEFIFGMLLAWWRLNDPRPRQSIGYLFLLAGLLGLLVNFILLPDNFEALFPLFYEWWVRPLFWGFPTALLVAWAVTVNFRPQNVIARIGIFIGDASYAIYLFHFVVVQALASMSLSPWLLFTLAMSSGVLVHLLIERQILRAAKRWRKVPPAVEYPIAIGAAGAVPTRETTSGI
jgi:exopolysaccharide production protein ExoZ